MCLTDVQKLASIGHFAYLAYFGLHYRFYANDMIQINTRTKH